MGALKYQSTAVGEMVVTVGTGLDGGGVVVLPPEPLLLPPQLESVSAKSRKSADSCGRIMAGRKAWRRSVAPFRGLPRWREKGRVHQVHVRSLDANLGSATPE